MAKESVFELLADEDIRAVTNYTTAQIWEKRNFLSGTADYKFSPDKYVRIKRANKKISNIIRSTGIDSPAVEIRPGVDVIDEVKMIKVYLTHTTSVHEFNDVIARYNYALNNTSKVKEQDAIDILKNWSLSNYDKVVTEYTEACEEGICMALSNEKGWVIPYKENQEGNKYNPNIEHSTTGALADFDTNDPTLMLLNDIVLKAQMEGYSPNVIYVGDAVATAIIQSQWYNNNNRTAPVHHAFSYTPRESNQLVVAKGAIELVGINVAGCKIIWINSKIDGKSVFDVNCAVALNDNMWASIYSSDTMAEFTLHNDIIRFSEPERINEKQLRYWYEYFYLPVIEKPGEIFRCYYK